MFYSLTFATDIEAEAKVRDMIYATEAEAKVQEVIDDSFEKLVINPQNSEHNPKNSEHNQEEIKTDSQIYVEDRFKVSLQSKNLNFYIQKMCLNSRKPAEI